MILTLEARQSLTFFWFNTFARNRWFWDMFHMSAVLSRGYILVTLNVIFEEAIFNVSSYDERKHGVKLQEYVRQPEIYMLMIKQLSFLTG